jgi:ribosomal protein S18 acetylase RimI-like enzyme
MHNRMVQPLQTSAVSVRPAGAADRESLDALLIGSWGELRAAANGRLYQLNTLPALLAITETGELVGAVTYEISDDTIEVVSIDATTPNRGVGTALLEAAAAIGTAAKLRLLWLVTTNDNLDALRFYQRRGLHILEVRPNAVAASRTLKPAIPHIGAYGIPIRDEIVLGRTLAPSVEL